MADDLVRAGAALPAVSGEVRFSGFAEVWRFAEAMAEARGFVPDAYIGKPAALAACVMTGLELGLGPMAAIRGLHNVKGRVMLDASLVAALAIRGGVQIDYEVNTDVEVRVRLSRGGRSHVEGFTMEDAKRAGLVSDGGMYRKYPRRMLQARALGIAVRAWCPDVLGGPIYVDGELDAQPEQPRAVEATVVPAQPAPAQGQQARRATARDQLEACGTETDLLAWAERYSGPLSRTTPERRSDARTALLDAVARVGDLADWDAEYRAQALERISRLAGLAERATDDGEVVS